MPVEKMKKVNHKASGPVYVRLQNLPWTACHQDVRDFLKDYVIPPGGISIHNQDAFVLVETSSSLSTTMPQDGATIHGCPVQLSVIGHEDFRQIISENVKRHLAFLTPRKLESKLVERFVYRKIRPTPVPIMNARVASLCTVFNPEEIDLPASNQNVSRVLSRPIFVKRKIKPTRVTEFEDFTRLFLPVEEDLSALRCSKKLRYTER